MSHTRSPDKASVPGDKVTIQYNDVKIGDTRVQLMVGERKASWVWIYHSSGIKQALDAKSKISGVITSVEFRGASLRATRNLGTRADVGG
jgi:hypothetical protein